MEGHTFCVAALLSLAAFSAVSANGDCPQVFCYMPCEFGYETTEGGCRTCTCRTRQGVEAPSCANLRCLIPCDTGYAFDRTGCLSCDCAPLDTVAPVNPSLGVQPQNDCYRIKCLLPCGGGYRVDANDCPTCLCADSAGSGDSAGSAGSGPIVQEANVAEADVIVNKPTLPSWLLTMLRNFGF